MKKKIWIFPILAAVAATVFLGGPLLKKRDQPAAFRTAAVVRRDIGARVVATGIVKPMVGAEVKVGSRVSGVVRRLRAQIGDTVVKGQVIAEIDDLEFQARHQQAEAARVKAEADLEYALMNRDRLRSLLEQNIVSRQEADLTENAYKTALAQLDQAEANLEYARVQLGYTKIHAPVSGVIASISTQEGETVAASLASPTFVNIIDLGRLEVQAYVDETDIGRIRTGLEAVFTVDTYPDTDFRGEVTAIYPKAVIQDNVVNYIVTVAITDAQDKTLRPEMTANVAVVLETRRGVLTVPTAAIVRDMGRRYVTVLDDGATDRREVRVGWRDEGFTEILNGLSEGETVIVPDI